MSKSQAALQRTSPLVPKQKVLVVLVGFPIISTLLSLLLLKRDVFQNLGLDFFSAFWLLIIGWYVAQILILTLILKSENLNCRDIGYSLGTRKTFWFVMSYLVFAFALVGFVEYVLGSANISDEKMAALSDFSNLTPKTTSQRIIFIFAGLVAGISEEFVYRGFAINAFESYKINKWFAIFLASVPFVFQHGLKSVDQFWWFFISGVILGILFILFKRKLYVNIVLHWLVILSAVLAILQVLE